MGGVPVRLRHGRWSLEVRGDEVADLSFDGVLLLRAVRPVVRDRDWNTVAVTVLDQQPFGDRASTLVSRLEFSAAGIRYDGVVTVTLDDDSLLVDFEGRAATEFEANRIGLVVLHPAADAGRAVDVRHTDGQVVAGSWPTAISPHQPFRDVAGFAWRKDGVSATLALTGDVFETEDQRNWTDASFKTYSTPLSRPFPVAVAVGASRRQQVRLTAGGRASGSAAATDDVVTVQSAVVGTMPTISLGASLYPPPGSLFTGQASYETVLVELAGAEDRWPALVDTALVQADALGAHLDVRLVTADPAAVERAVDLLPLDRVLRLAAFDPISHLSTLPLWQALVSPTRRRDFRGQLVAGTRAHFTELNRQVGQLPVDAPALTFSLTPQMHATEIPHLIDSLATQTTVASNAVALARHRPVHVGPITLTQRFNAVATTGTADPEAEAARAVDPLQTTDFAAAWTLGSVAALAPTGVASLCYFETAGPRGLRDDDGPYPVAAVLDRTARLRGRPVLSTTAPAGIAALAVLATDGSTQVMVANLSARARTIRVDAPTDHRTLELAPWACSLT